MRFSISVGALALAVLTGCSSSAPHACPAYLPARGLVVDFRPFAATHAAATAAALCSPAGWCANPIGRYRLFLPGSVANAVLIVRDAAGVELLRRPVDVTVPPLHRDPNSCAVTGRVTATITADGELRVAS